MKLKAEFEEKQEELETAFAERAPNAKVSGGGAFQPSA
jgi:hypothetical protein